MAGKFRFSFGPWNIHEGADPFGPAVRESIEFNKKLGTYKKMGFDGVQFHDDDAVPGMNALNPKQIIAEAKKVKAKLDEHGLIAEFVADRQVIYLQSVENVVLDLTPLTEFMCKCDIGFSGKL